MKKHVLLVLIVAAGAVLLSMGGCSPLSSRRDLEGTHSLGEGGSGPGGELAGETDEKAPGEVNEKASEEMDPQALESEEAGGRLTGEAGEEAVEEANEQSRDTELFFSKPEDKPASVAIKVFKARRILELYGDDVLIGRFKIALGGNPVGDKMREGDSKTPEGTYYICTRNDQSRFTWFLGISYPNVEDAQRGLDNGLIDRTTFQEIKSACERGQRPPWDTPLGGAVGIHAGSNDYDWTQGCIALCHEDMEILWEYVPMNTPVEIMK